MKWYKLKKISRVYEISPPTKKACIVERIMYFIFSTYGEQEGIRFINEKGEIKNVWERLK